MSSYVEEWHAKQRAQQVAEEPETAVEPQVYEFIQQTPPAQAAVDPRIKAYIDAEKREQLQKVKPQIVPLTRATSGGFSHITPTPPAGRGFGEVQQR